MGDSKACDDDFLQKQLLENSLNLIKIQERMIQNLCAENEILKITRLAEEVFQGVNRGEQFV